MDADYYFFSDGAGCRQPGDKPMPDDELNLLPPDPLPCGCRARAVRVEPDSLAFHVEHCPLHEAASEMLAALRAMLSSQPFSEAMEAAVSIARAAIARAERGEVSE